MPLILASTSPRRKEILTQAGIEFDSFAPNYEEDMTLDMPPRELVQTLALGKAQAVAILHAGRVVLGADTIIVDGLEVLGKPHTKERAREMLHQLSGRMHSVLTGFALIDDGGESVTGVSEVVVTMREISDAEIERYLETGEPLDKAGAYAIQEKGGTLVERIEGDYLGMVGLPLALIIPELRKLGKYPY